MSDNNQDFEALRRLLALKRHEVPPPGYFEDFSSNVLARIRAQESVRKLPWLLRLLQAFESRPAYPVSFASALCLVLLFGIVSVQQSPEVAQVFGGSDASSAFSSMGTPTTDAQDSSQPLMAVVSTNPPTDLSSSSTLFNTSSSGPSFPQTALPLTGN
jgi:hypothetical protein